MVLDVKGTRLTLHYLKMLGLRPDEWKRSSAVQILRTWDHSQAQMIQWSDGGH